MSSPNQARRELLPFFNNTPYHPAFAMALTFLPKIRRLTARRGQHELRKQEEIGCLAGVAAVLAFERVGLASELPVETARRLASSTKAHFTSTLNHCRPLVIAQRASTSTAGSPHSAAGKAAERGSLSPSPARPAKTSIGSASTPTAASQSTSGQNRETQSIDPLAIMGSTKKVAPAVVARGKKLDLSGLRRNKPGQGAPLSATVIGESSVSDDPAATSLGDMLSASSPSSNNIHMRTAASGSAFPDPPLGPSQPSSQPAPVQAQPRTPAKLRQPSRLHSPSPSKGSPSGSPMHAGLMRGRLEALRAGDQDVQVRSEAEDEIMDDRDSVGGRNIGGSVQDYGRDRELSAAGPSTWRNDRPFKLARPTTRDISSTSIPISPCIPITLASIEPLAPYFTATNFIYPPPSNPKDRVFGRMIVPDERKTWPDWGRDGSRRGEAQGEEGENGYVEERRNKRRKRVLTEIINEYGTREADANGAGPRLGKKPKRRFNWDAAFHMPSGGSGADYEDEADVESDEITWESRLEEHCAHFLPQLRAILNPSEHAQPESETNVSRTDQQSQDKAGAASQGWLERADARGIGVRLWLAGA